MCSCIYPRWRKLVEQPQRRCQGELRRVGKPGQNFSGKSEGRLASSMRAPPGVSVTLARFFEFNPFSPSPERPVIERKPLYPFVSPLERDTRAQTSLGEQRDGHAIDLAFSGLICFPGQRRLRRSSLRASCFIGSVWLPAGAPSSNLLQSCVVRIRDRGRAPPTYCAPALTPPSRRSPPA